jgi:hypothetical protein
MTAAHAMLALCTLLVAESIMVPKNVEFTDPALPVMLQKEVEQIHDEDALQSVIGQRACQTRGFLNGLAALTRKLDFMTHSFRELPAWWDKNKHFAYILVSASLTLAQLLLDGRLATVGETASTSPATALNSDKDCRDKLMDAMTAAVSQELDQTILKKSSDCIMNDMDKCVVTTRVLEWWSAAVETFQSVLDTFWRIDEIRETRDAVQASALEGRKDDAEVREKAAAEKAEVLERVHATQDMISNIEALVQRQKTYLRSQGYTGE